MVDLVEWEKLTQEGKGMKAKAKPLKRLEVGASSMQWRCQQEGRQTNPEAQRQEDYGRFPAKKIGESSSVLCFLLEIIGEVITQRKEGKGMIQACRVRRRCHFKGWEGGLPWATSKDCPAAL